MPSRFANSTPVISCTFERRFTIANRMGRPAVAHGVTLAELQVAPPQLRLVAAHAWDVLGAMRAGCAAAFVARPGKALFPLADTPDIVGRDLRNVADEIVKRDMPK